MTNDTEKIDKKREELDRFAEIIFPDLSSSALVDAAIAFERTLK